MEGILYYCRKQHGTHEDRSALEIQDMGSVKDSAYFP